MSLNSTQVPEDEIDDDQEQEQNQGQQPTGSTENHNIKQLRKKAEQAAVEAARADKAELELAIHKAGLDGLSQEQREALLAVHKGDKTEKELQETATRLGMYEPPAEVDPVVQQGHEQVAEASKGAQTVNPSSQDEEIGRAANEAEVLEILRRNGTAVDMS